MPNKDRQARRERIKAEKEGHADVRPASQMDEERPAVAPPSISRCDFRSRDCHIRTVRNGWIVSYNGDEYTFNTTVDMLMFVATAFDVEVK
jgi:hypothetical protein